MHRSRLSDHKKSHTLPTLGWIGVKAFKNRCSLLRKYFSCENTDFLSKLTLFDDIAEIRSYSQYAASYGSTLLDIVALAWRISSFVSSCAVLSSNTSLLSRRTKSSTINDRQRCSSTVFSFRLPLQNFEVLVRKDFPARTKWFSNKLISMELPKLP